MGEIVTFSCLITNGVEMEYSTQIMSQNEDGGQNNAAARHR